MSFESGLRKAILSRTPLLDGDTLRVSLPGPWEGSTGVLRLRRGSLYLEGLRPGLEVGPFLREEVERVV